MAAFISLIIVVIINRLSVTHRIKEVLVNPLAHVLLVDLQKISIQTATTVYKRNNAIYFNYIRRFNDTVEFEVEYDPSKKKIGTWIYIVIRGKKIVNEPHKPIPQELKDILFKLYSNKYYE